MKNALLVAAALASGLISGFISQGIWGSGNWFTHPGLLFGLATAWLVLLGGKYKIVRAVLWILVSTAAFQASLFLYFFESMGVVITGGAILALTFQWIFHIKNRYSLPFILIQIGMIAVLGVISYLALDNEKFIQTYLFIAWQSVAVICIISGILIDKKIATRAIHTN